MTDDEKTPEEIEKGERFKAAYLKSSLPADHPLSKLGIVSNPTDEEKSDPVQEALNAQRRKMLDAENAKKQKRQARLGESQESASSLESTKQPSELKKADESINELEEQMRANYRRNNPDPLEQSINQQITREKSLGHRLSRLWQRFMVRFIIRH